MVNDFRGMAALLRKLEDKIKQLADSAPRHACTPMFAADSACREVLRRSLTEKGQATTHVAVLSAWKYSIVCMRNSKDGRSHVSFAGKLT